MKKQTREFLAQKTLRDKFGGVNAMKIFLGIDKIPPALERPFKAATIIKRELTGRHRDGKHTT